MLRLPSVSSRPASTTTARTQRQPVFLLGGVITGVVDKTRNAQKSWLKRTTRSTSSLSSRRILDFAVEDSVRTSSRKVARRRMSRYLDQVGPHDQWEDL